jgi:hypothetical protein
MTASVLPTPSLPLATVMTGLVTTRLLCERKTAHRIACFARHEQIMRIALLRKTYSYASDKRSSPRQTHRPQSMHDLIPLAAALPGALTVAEIDATMAYAEAEKALATRAAYASDWRDFAAWCGSRGATAMPAHVGIVAAYLSSVADSGRKASTIGRRAAAIGYHHRRRCAECASGQKRLRLLYRGVSPGQNCPVPAAPRPRAASGVRCRCLPIRVASVDVDVEPHGRATVSTHPQPLRCSMFAVERSAAGACVVLMRGAVLGPHCLQFDARIVCAKRG